MTLLRPFEPFLSRNARDYPFLKGLSHLDDLANLCRFIKKFPNTFSHVEYVIRKFCIR